MLVDRPLRKNPSSRWMVLSLLGLLGLVSSARAQLNPEIFIGTDRTQPAIEVGPGDNIALTYVNAGQIWVRYAPSSSAGSPLQVTTAPLAHSSPDVYTSSAGQTTFVYEREPNTMGPHEGNEVIIQTGVSGNPINLSSSFSADYDPRITGVFSRDIVWTRDNAGVSEVVASINVMTGMVVAMGEEPRLETDASGNRHLVYVRDSELYYRVQVAGVWGAEEPVPTALGPISSPSLAIDVAGNLHLVVVADGSVHYLRRNVGEAFAAPILISGPELGADHAKIFSGSSGVVVTFLRDGDVWKVLGAASFFAPPVNLTNTPADPEQNVAVGLDSIGALHLAYERGGALFYRNEVAPPVASFAVSETSGEVPLTVSFTDMSTGVIGSRLWSFGDGTTSTAVNPTHTYDTTGTYSVTLSLTGPGGADSLLQPALIQVIDPTNFLKIAPVTVFQGQDDVFIPILATNSDPIQGFQLALVWDCTVFEVTQITVASTTVSALTPEFVIDNIDTDLCQATVGVVFDFLAPFDGRTLAPGIDQRVANVVADIPSTAAIGPSLIELVNGLGDPPIFNIFTVAGISVLPILDSGFIEITPLTFPPPIVFLRGDVDRTGTLEITDAIVLLEFLFSAGAPPQCADAADANDSGSIDVADVISILSFLFSGGAVLPYPYPSVGLDPTDDALGC